MSDTTDFFRDRERTAWRDYLANESVENLLVWRRALQNLNDELNARADALVEKHLELRRVRPVQTPGNFTPAAQTKE